MIKELSNYVTPMREFPKFHDMLVEDLRNDADFAAAYLHNAFIEFQQDKEIYFLALSLYRLILAKETTPAWLQKLHITDIERMLWADDGLDFATFYKMIYALGYTFSIISQDSLSAA